jgi:hypothetical protein
MITSTDRVFGGADTWISGLEVAMPIEDVIASVLQARVASRVAAIAAWIYVQENEPSLAECLEVLGLEVEDAGVWLITPWDNCELSPIELVAASRVNEVVSAIRRSQHGFSA